MKAAFLGPAYKSRSLPLACQTVINLIFEPAAPGSGEQGMFYTAPGLALVATLGTGPVRGMKVAGGVLWVVSGTRLYRYVNAANVTDVGFIPGTGRVTLVDNESQIVVMHDAGWAVCDFATVTLATVTDAPLTAQGTYLGGRIVFPQDDGTYGWTELNTASALDALNFASAESRTDPAIATFADHGELLVLGTRSVEWYVESGDAELPYTRVAVSEYGCAAKHSVAALDNTVFWLGRDDKGDPRVYRANGRSPQGVSDYAIDLALSGYSNIESAFAYGYQQQGHTYYVLTIPDEATWCYDISTGQWSQRAYRIPTSGNLIRHRANCHAYYGGSHLVGDYENGRIYRLDPTVHTDNGDPIYWERTWAHIESENKRLRYNRLEVMAEFGTELDGATIASTSATNPGDPVVTGSVATLYPSEYAPEMRLVWSDDGGRTFPGFRELPLGALGQYTTRAVTYRLGIGRRRIFRLYGSAPVKTALYGVNVDVSPMRK